MIYDMIYDTIYLLTAIGLSPGGSGTVHIYTQTIYRTQITTEQHKYTRCAIDTINSPDDGHMAVRNLKRTEINTYEKELCVKLVIYKDYTEMLHGQQNVKFCPSMFKIPHAFYAR
jgi:hypothetical protein